MSEPKRSSFLPKWARDGRDYMGDFPNIGVPEEETEMSESNDNVSMQGFKVHWGAGASRPTAVMYRILDLTTSKRPHG